MIEKITDQNLERYDSRLKEWCDRKFFEKGNYGKYQTTEEAGAVAFYPAPDTPLKGKVKFNFKEMPPANGDKGPENPSTITGVSSVKVTRCGKNLVHDDNLSTLNIGSNYVTYTKSDDGGLVFSGTAPTVDSSYVYTFNSAVNNKNLFPDYIIRGKTYRVTAYGQYNPYVSFSVFVSRDGGSWGNSIVGVNAGGSVVFTVPENATGMIIRYTVAKGQTVDDVAIKAQITELDVDTSYEKYIGTDYTLPFGNTYYGGDINFITGVMTVTHFGVVFDGTTIKATSNIGDIGTDYRHGITLSAAGFPKAAQASSSNQASTHFGYLNGLSGVFGTYVITGNYLVIHDKNGLYPDESSFNAWLATQYNAGTPVSFVYTVETPYTVQLSPLQIYSLSQFNKYTPRLNTVYTDADSIQISYLKSPIRDEYEKTQAILSLGGNS